MVLDSCFEEVLRGGSVLESRSSVRAVELQNFRLVTARVESWSLLQISRELLYQILRHNNAVDIPMHTGGKGCVPVY